MNPSINIHTNPTQSQSFADRLTAAVVRCGNPVVVGLDPRWDELPARMREVAGEADPEAQAEAYFTFCREVIDVVAPLVPVVKPQMAFFEQLGPAGMCALANVIQHARKTGLIVLLDGKRNDIGSTATAYAEAYLGEDSPWQGDALTVSPYLGNDSLDPFVARAIRSDAGIFVLVKTSNPGGGQFQDLKTPDEPLYRAVGTWVEKVASESVSECGYGAVGAVVGATYPDQLAELRALMPHAWLLIPGYGAQGAAAKDVAAAFHPKGLGAIINSSRGIIFAYSRREYRERFAATKWQGAVEQATRGMIDELRSVMPGNLTNT